MAKQNSLNNAQSPNSSFSQRSSLAIANLVSGGNIGTAPNTVDINSSFILTQTTAAQVVTLPDPTDTTPARLVILESSSSSTVAFTFYGSTISPGDAISVQWNGSGWVLVSPTIGQTWLNISANQAGLQDEGYAIIAGANIDVSLPAVAASGSLFSIVATNVGTGWTVSQLASQSIIFANSQSTAGVGGSIASTNRGDALNLVCVLPNLLWVAISSIGNLNIV